MNFPTTYFRVQFYLILLLAGGILSACQAPQPQCCHLEYGLLQTSDLSGKWELVDTPVQIIQPTGSRYSAFPPSESTRQYLSSNPDARNRIGVIIHDLRDYVNLAPALGKLDSKLDPEDAGIPFPAPNMPEVGQGHQVQCLASSPSDSGKSVIVCTIEVRYQHILSTMHFYFDGSTSSDNIETLINEALTRTDSRIKEIDKHLGKSDS